MARTTILRSLIIAEVFFIVGSLIAEFLLEHTMPREIQEYVTRSEATPATLPQLIGFGAGIVLLAGLLVSWIGLWRLWKPARLLYTTCWLFQIPIYLLLDSVVYSTSLGAALEECSTLIAGMILGMLYFSELSNHFGRSKRNTV